MVTDGTQHNVTLRYISLRIRSVFESVSESESFSVGVESERNRAQESRLSSHQMHISVRVFSLHWMMTINLLCFPIHSHFSLSKKILI